MKKGASHVDWAISMGIFLIYVLLMFIFLKPGSQPAYNENTLLDIVSSGLKDNATFTIDKKQLIITPTSGVTTIDDITGCTEDKKYILRIRDLDKSGMDMDWVASEEKGENQLVLVNDSLGKIGCENMLAVPFDFKDENEPGNPPGGRDWNVLEIETCLKQGANIFWFMYSEEIKYVPHTTVSTIGLPDATCITNTRCLLDDKVISSECPVNFTYQFGIVESFTAFSQDKLTELNENYGDKYEDLKKKWGFPEDKNFNITIEKLS